MTPGSLRCRHCVGAAAVFTLLIWQAAPLHAAGVYVAGQGFSLEQAFEQAARENEGTGQRFWIVASGEAARQVADGQASGLLERIRKRGGIVQVCARDLQGMAPTTLPRGVSVVPVPASAASGSEATEAEDAGEAMPQSDSGYRLILRACGALQ